MQFVALFGTSVVFVAFVAAGGFLRDSQLPCGGFGWSVLCAQKIGLIRSSKRATFALLNSVSNIVAAVGHAALQSVQTSQMCP